MSAATNIALLAAARQAGSESIEARLRAAGALDSGTAIAFEPANATEQTLLDQGLASCVFGRNADGQIYLSERALADRNHSQGWIALVVLLLIGSILASAVALIAALD